MNSMANLKLVVGPTFERGAVKVSSDHDVVSLAVIVVEC
jgi:hypothetical protein